MTDGSIKAKRKIILKELLACSKKLGKDRFSRTEFLTTCKAPITQHDIVKEFGSFAKAMKEAGLIPAKHPKISNEELFLGYERVMKKTKKVPLGMLGYELLDKHSGFRATTYKKRFGGLKNFYFEYRTWESEGKPKKDKYAELPSLEVVAKEKLKTPRIRKLETTSEVFEKKAHYYGTAGEYLVISELLFLGYKAALDPIDEGADVFAIMSGKLFLIQVKHRKYKQNKVSPSIKIKLSTYQKTQGSNMFYVIVLNRINPPRRLYLVLPFSKLDELKKSKVIKVQRGAKQFTFKVIHENNDGNLAVDESDAYINCISDRSNVSEYVNAWYLIS